MVNIPIIYRVLAPSQVVFAPDFGTINSSGPFGSCGGVSDQDIRCLETHWERLGWGQRARELT